MGSGTKDNQSQKRATRNDASGAQPELRPAWAAKPTPAIRAERDQHSLWGVISSVEKRIGLFFDHHGYQREPHVEALPPHCGRLLPFRKGEQFYLLYAEPRDNDYCLFVGCPSDEAVLFWKRGNDYIKVFGWREDFKSLEDLFARLLKLMEVQP